MCGMQFDTTRTLSRRMADSVIGRYRPGMMKWHYEHGLVIMAAMRVGETCKDSSYYDWGYSMYNPLISDTGAIATYREGEFNLDQINAGRNLFCFYGESGEERFKLAADRLKSQLKRQPRTLAGPYWHKEIYPWQIWLDGLYMQGPFNVEYSATFGDDGAFDDVCRQLLVTHEKLLDPKTGLLYHAWDESRGQRWSDIDTGCSPHFWGRAIGWYCMAILDVLDYLPEGHVRIPELKSVLRKLLASILKFQDPSGMWWQVVDEAGRKGNYLETSASSMFCYSLFKASRLGILDDVESCIAAAKRGMQGIRGKYLREDPSGELHLGGICSVAGLGGNPYRDGSFRYYVLEPVVEDDFKGVGPFILACIEEERQ